MNKRKLEFLEKAWAAEIDSALGSGFGILQSRSRLIDELVSDGLLQQRVKQLGGRFPMTISGYELTELGRLTYCMSCN